MMMLMLLKMMPFILNSMILFTQILMIINPISLMMNFILFTLSSSLIIFMNLNTPLYSFMISISLIGGMMIMFNYFISLINNENSKINFQIMIIMYLYMISMFMIILILSIMTPTFMLIFSNNYTLKITKLMDISYMYMYPFNLLTSFTIMFLILCMILSFKMVTHKFFPLRKIN